MTPRRRRSSPPVRSEASSPEVVTPPRLVRYVMRPMTKVLNPVMKRVSGRRHMALAATVLHQGRRTGQIYSTPTGARLAGAEFLIPLTFGTESDWCRNLRAADGGRIRFKASTYEVVAPRVVRTKAIRPLIRQTYPVFMRGMFKMLGIKVFLRMEIVSSISPSLAPQLDAS